MLSPIGLIQLMGLYSWGVISSKAEDPLFPTSLYLGLKITSELPSHHIVSPWNCTRNLCAFSPGGNSKFRDQAQLARKAAVGWLYRGPTATHHHLDIKNYVVTCPLHDNSIAPDREGCWSLGTHEPSQWAFTSSQQPLSCDLSVLEWALAAWGCSPFNSEWHSWLPLWQDLVRRVAFLPLSYRNDRNLESPNAFLGTFAQYRWLHVHDENAWYKPLPVGGINWML